MNDEAKVEIVCKLTDEDKKLFADAIRKVDRKHWRTMHKLRVKVEKLTKELRRL